MITINKLKSAIGRYVDEEFTMSMNGLMGFGVGAVIGLYLKKMDAVVLQYEKQLVEMKILNPDGTIDIDLVYQILTDQFSKKRKCHPTITNYW